ncbi:MAG: F0F1 ATP synthase subunit gamma [Dechloromonas sp.]|nr:F0F1 ATP synthase subunit gamma [Dechloromonas sp.]
MSRRRELARRLASLTELAGIMSAMKGLALMEIRVLQDFLATQRRMVTGIETAAAQFFAWHGDLAVTPPPDSELCIVVGSEQGFCGDFNETVLKRWETVSAGTPRKAACLIVGERLASRFQEGAPPLLQLPGASVADEVPGVLLRLTSELSHFLTSGEMRGSGVSVLYHCDATGETRLRRLLPLRDLPPPARSGYPPDLNLPAADFLAGLTRHYLHAALNEVLYSSLLAESRQRHAHMDSALNKLDEDSDRLRLAYNAQRQEDITEEIEVILLSAGLLQEEPARQGRHSG